MVQFQLLFPELRHFEKNGARHSLIGCHLESVHRTKLVFKLKGENGETQQVTYPVLGWSFKYDRPSTDSGFDHFAIFNSTK